MTSAVLVSALFTAACAVFAITFVAARGGLTMPVAASLPPVAQASPSAVSEPTDEPTRAPASAGPSPPPSIPPTVAPTSRPTAIPTAPPPTPDPSSARPTLEPGDPLYALAECPGHPGCFEYVVQRFDTLSGVITRYRLDYDVLLVLNPSLVDPSLVVTGQTLFLGRDPSVLLEPCPGGGGCLLYVVRSGDSLGEIAALFDLERDAILASNPGLASPIQPGQVIRLPLTP